MTDRIYTRASQCFFLQFRRQAVEKLCFVHKQEVGVNLQHFCGKKDCGIFYGTESILSI